MVEELTADFLTTYNSLLMDSQSSPVPFAPIPPPLPKSNIWVLITVGVMLFGGGIAAGLFLGKQLYSQSIPTPAPSPISYPTPTSDPTADWKTYTNSVYQYSISTPPDFVLQLCSDCQPPEVEFSLQNSSNSISLTIEYAHQFSITGNLSSKPSPTHNLKVTIQGKLYSPEEYYVVGEKSNYIFKIDDVSRNNQPSQISLSGGYTRPEEAQLISQILSTFKFLDVNGSKTSSQRVNCTTPRPELCTLECMVNPPYICGSNSQSYCTTCQACADPQVAWYVIQSNSCSRP